MAKLLHDTYIHNLIRLEIRKWELRKDYISGNKKSTNFSVKENGKFKVNNIESTCQMLWNTYKTGCRWKFVALALEDRKEPSV